MMTEASAKKDRGKVSKKKRTKRGKRRTTTTEIHKRAQGFQDRMKALGCAVERADLAPLGAVITVDVEAFMLADAAAGRAGTAGDGILIGQGAIREFHHSVVWDHFEVGSGR
jgi:predicted secreted protein